MKSMELKWRIMWVKQHSWCMPWRCSFGVDTIRILGFHKNRQLVIFIDSGSTTSFLDKKASLEMKLGLVAIPPSAVTIEDRRKLCCDHISLEFKWKMQKYKFQFDIKTLELGGFDMILGVNWLGTHNPV